MPEAGERGRPPRVAAVAAVSAEQAPERLQKFLAAAGCGSRREIDTLIAAGRVAVNGKPAVPGQKVVAADRITIDGKPCYTARATGQVARVIAVHKPADVVCTRRDPEGRPTIFDLLPSGVRRWIMVGRLDITTSGLVLFTDDGELAHRLMHPSHHVPRHYAVRVLGDVDAHGLIAMRRGVEIDGEVLKFDAVTPRGGSGVNQWYECELHTGRNREVRRLWEHAGLVVSRLIRIRFGPIGLPRNVPAGRWFEVTGAALEELYTLVGLEAPPPPPTRREPRSAARPAGVARRQGKLGRRPN
jgi:23S rRNA pseudouridine2605 synthase